MRCSSFLSSLVVILAAGTRTATVSAQSPLPTPVFEPLFAGQLTISSIYNTTGPFGTRGHYGISGGNLTDAKTGKRVATILPCADDGILSDSGVFFPEAVLPVIWDVDGHLASIRVAGIGNLNGGEIHYVHVETDSPTYSWMNSKFFIENREAMGLQPVFTIFGVSDASSSY